MTGAISRNMYRYCIAEDKNIANSNPGVMLGVIKDVHVCEHCGGKAIAQYELWQVEKQVEQLKAQE